MRDRGTINQRHGIYRNWFFDDPCTGNPESGMHKFVFSNGRVICEYCGKPAARDTQVTN